MSLFEIVILLAAAIIAVPLAKKLGLGSVLGYLAAGVVVGPRALGLLTNIETIKHISEYGVVLLLFVIGLELKPSRLWVMRQLVFGLGFLQVALTTIVLGGGAYLFGMQPETAFVVGFGLSLSSTAFVLPMLAERKALSKAYGQASFSILLFQDLAVIPMLVLLPVLAGGADALPGDGHDVLIEIGIALGATIAVLIGGRYLTRPLLRVIAGAGYQEVLHRCRAADRDCGCVDPVDGRPVGVAGCVSRRRAAGRQRVPARAGSRHRTVQRPVPRPVLYGRRHERESCAAGREAADHFLAGAWRDDG